MNIVQVVRIVKLVLIGAALVAVVVANVIMFVGGFWGNKDTVTSCFEKADRKAAKKAAREARRAAKGEVVR